MKKREEIKKFRAFVNNLYSIRLMWNINKDYVVHSAITTGIDYFAWVFYSAFFIRYLVGAIEQSP